VRDCRAVIHFSVSSDHGQRYPPLGAAHGLVYRRPGARGRTGCMLGSRESTWLDSRDRGDCQADRGEGTVPVTYARQRVEAGSAAGMQATGDLTRTVSASPRSTWQRNRGCGASRCRARPSLAPGIARPGWSRRGRTRSGRQPTVRDGGMELVVLAHFGYRYELHEPTVWRRRNTSDYHGSELYRTVAHVRGDAWPGLAVVC
jgi:hypothetical protein